MILRGPQTVMIRNMMAQIGSTILLDEGMLRHMIPNVLRANRKKFNNEYGELIDLSVMIKTIGEEKYSYHKAGRRKK